jgi:hypothetical protein
MRPPDRGPPKRESRPRAESGDLENTGNGGSNTTRETFSQLSRLRRQRAAARVRRLGARVVFELINEICRRYPSIAADLDHRFARFAAIDPGILAAVGGDRFAASPMRLVKAAR